MLREKDRVIRTVIICLDAAVVFFVFFISFRLRPFLYVFYKFDLVTPNQIILDSMPVSATDYIAVLSIVISLWCFMLLSNGMYRPMRTRRPLELAWIIIKSAFFVTVLFGACVFLLKLRFVSRLFFGIFMLLSFAGIISEKIAIYSVIHYLRRRGYNHKRLLIVGTGSRAANFIEMVRRHPEWGFRILGVIEDEKAQKGRKIEDVEIIGDLDSIPKIIQDNPVDEVIFIVPRSRLDHIANSLYVCETAGIRPTIAVDLFDLKIGKPRSNELEGIPLVTFETTSAREWELFLKRSADLIISGLGLLLLSPLLLIVAILIKLTSKGPVLFMQKRIGLNGRKFILYKYRTMHEGADKSLSKLARLNMMNGPVFKIKDDPRITPAGRYLRKFSIDELPQLLNVFMGHMSLVGPRPAIAREVARYEPWQRRRLSMRPGITCIWQVSGRNKIDFEEWMRMDLRYIDNWSPWLDFKILVKTIPVVAFGIGAY